ncbi:Gfo/Idh/MocA family oxidoreductase [Algoriphagus halophytocola]|uniref:Gfo/Idh/MocA family protein n=1 Tax=Algoriphagus halophytocola TaxID=2991499 RepID=UPI0022DD7A1F|nr:Gfo/Idh/MocA family oxidoreductase [Algoriphagus sp. TR-M9]WBL41758.1 Gfo/Idh/MocA family oxidoreductase [Algoriphagus sp. TR-M9]
MLPKTPRPIAIIGAGGIVTDAHLPAYTLAGWQVMGIYDLDFAKAEVAKNKFSIVSRTYSDLSELIKAAADQNAVFDLAVPADQIIPILKQLPDGSAVLIQKPMGETSAEAEVILELCELKNLLSAVNFQLKFAPYMLASKDMIQKGLLGKIYDLELKVCVYTPWHLWGFLKEKPRMEVLYHSVHYLDLIRSFMGNPTRIHASVLKSPKSPDLADARSSIILDYDEVTQARILTNHGHDFGSKNQESYFKIEGTKGAIKITIGLSLDYPKGQAPKMEYCLLDNPKGWQEIPLKGGWFPQAFIGSMAALQVTCENPGTHLSNSTADALQTMKLVETVYKASESGGTPFGKIS